MSDMRKANRQVRRASGFLGFLATVWLVGFWVILIGLVALIVWAYAS